MRSSGGAEGEAREPSARLASTRPARSIPDALPEITAAFEERINELAAEVIARQRAEIPELGDIDAPAAWEVNREIVVRGRRAQASSLRTGRQPQVCPQADVSGARLAAAAGLSRETLLHAYHVGHKRTVAAWLEAIDSTALDREAWQACRKLVTDFLDEYDQRIMRWVIEAYDLERSARPPDTRSQRVRAIRTVLDGSAARLDGLDYDIDLCHLGAIALGPGAEKALSDLARALGRRLLSTPIDEERWMAWIGGRAPLGDRELRRIASFEPPPETSVALGEPAPGVEGFRRSHREAGEAAMIGASLGRRLVFYRDVSLEAAVLRDDRSRMRVACDYIRAELADLERGGEDERKLRRTLRAYFAESQSLKAAAAALGVDQKTVTRRIRAVEQRLGRQVVGRRAELELALRLHAVFHGE